MIARLRVLLPFELIVIPSVALQQWVEQVEGYEVLVHSPYKSAVDREALQGRSDAPLLALADQLLPADPQPLAATVQVDGQPAVLADTFFADLRRGEDFDRSPSADDPPVALMFGVVNGFIARLRTLTRASQLKPLSRDSSTWRVEFLRDDGSELEHDPALARGRGGFRSSGRWWHWALRSGMRHAALPHDFDPGPWDTLLLDAHGLLPDAGPALVLAATALETRIGSALDVLANAAAVEPQLWAWINDRGDYRKEPSTVEQLDPLLRGLTGRSLKDDSRLWEGFQNLRKARNSFAHEGQPMLGGVVVTGERARQLVALAGEIIDWIERLLPEALRRPTVDLEQTRVELTQPLSARDEPAPEGHD